jgi:murein DD-endopeptidase MepM/ murein hydrolase activator NlpD
MKSSVRSNVLWFLLLLLSALGCSTSRLNKDGKHAFFGRMLQSSTLAPDPEAPTEKSSQFQWPLRSTEVTSPFGRRWLSFHEGVDLRAPYGTPVYASRSGVVIYAEEKLRGYGKMVVILHVGKVATLYAHNSELLVHKGQQVKQGEQIAVSGESGNARRPHLHFEIRRGSGPLNPLEFLPELGQECSDDTVDSPE